MARSVRPSVRLDEQQMAQLKAAAQRNGTTVSEILRQGAQQVTEPAATPAPVWRGAPWDESTGRLMVLLRALDGIGLVDELRDARRLLAQGQRMRAEVAERVREADACRDALVADLAAGRVTVDEVPARLSGPQVWLDGQGQAPVWRGVLDRAERVLRQEAVQNAEQDMFAVHDVLAKRADDAVRRGVEAGRRLVDVKAVVKALTLPEIPPRYRLDTWRHPWVDHPPALPTVDGAALAADPNTAPWWAQASQAHRDLSALMEVARALHDAGGPGSRLFAGEVDDDVKHLVSGLPEQVHMAVADALGWKPGMHMTLRPMSQPVTVAPVWTPPVPPRVGPYGTRR